MKNLFNKLTSMVMTTVMLLGITLAAPALAFPDVQGHWAKTDILELAEKKILGGKDANWFDPEANITRAEYVAICNRAFPDAISVERNVQFSDVTSDYWFYADVLKAANAKLIEGRSSTTFDPMAPITRQEAAMVTHNYLSKIAFEFTTSAATIKDINAVAEFAKTAVTKLVQSGIISGYEDGEFRPNSNITRAESATVINRVLKKIAEEQGDISGLDPGKKPNQDIKPDHNCADPNCSGEHGVVSREDGATIIELDGKLVAFFEDGTVIIIEEEGKATLFAEFKEDEEPDRIVGLLIWLFKRGVRWKVVTKGPDGTGAIIEVADGNDIQKGWINYCMKCGQPCFSIYGHPYNCVTPDGSPNRPK